MGLEHDLLSLFHDTKEPVKADRQTIIRAPFGIPGTKTYSIERLMKLLPYRGKWADVFAGSGIVTFNRKISPVLEVLNDRYSGITAFYDCLKDKEKWERLRDYVSITLHSRESFYEAKANWCKETDDVTRGGKWFIMLRLSVIGKGDCFARSTNSKNYFVLPGSIPNFFPIHKRLQSVLIENLDFETCMRDFDSEDCVQYLDPPYLGTDPGVYEHKWTKDDLERLLRTIGNGRSFFALSGYDNEYINAQTFWDHKYTWKVPAKAEIQAFTAENNREGRENVQEIDYVEECLWVKE